MAKSLAITWWGYFIYSFYAFLLVWFLSFNNQPIMAKLLAIPANIEKHCRGYVMYLSKNESWLTFNIEQKCKTRNQKIKWKLMMEELFFDMFKNAGWFGDTNIWIESSGDKKWRFLLTLLLFYIVPQESHSQAERFFWATGNFAQG